MPNLQKFRELGLSEIMLESLRKKGFEEPTAIQAKTIPFLLNSPKDLIGKAQTGTGKTGAFGIPIIENIVAQSKKVQALILVPTRELAIQVTEELSSFAETQQIQIIAVYGGQPIERQIARLQRGVDIVVGTPGRIIDHLERKTLDISKIKYAVLDEADEMLNMGFIDDIEKILQTSPKNRRTVLFSATMPQNIERLAKQYMNDYEIISVMSEQISRDNIQQIYFEVGQADKFEALFRIIDVEDSFYGMVFCRTKVDADEIAHKLANRGCRAEAIHGDLSQGQREKVLKKFRTKQITTLVATDVAARGIDIDNLTHVINFSLPQDPESYVHRIGRTGRAGKTGTAITLITPSEYRKLTSLQRIANTKITKQKVPNVADVIDSKKQRIKSAIAEIIQNGGAQDLESIASEILKENTDPKIALSALLKVAFKDELNEKNYNEIHDIGSYKKNKDFYYDDHGMTGYRPIGDQEKRGYVDRKGTARLFIAKGRNDNLDPRKLVDFIEKTTGVSQRKIDDVKIMDNFSFFAVPFEDAEKVLHIFQQQSGGKKSLVSRAKKK
ncbi:MAG: DEAD/DEAH box helicase [Alphaproteobacteria bacterium]|nr:DEAD/DEAH box helicase [Alphaproteobacteria bacterium]